MKSSEIKQLFEKFEAAAATVEAVECWSAREMQSLLGYSKWENFEKVIQKAKDACNNAGEEVSNHFPDVRKMVSIGSGAEKEIDDILLTRYACYLVAQNGDSRKEEIAFAQNYFAVQTRRAELVEQRLLEFERVKAREKLSQTEKQLSGILFERGVDNQGFAIIRSKGDQALFRLSTPMLKKKMGAPDNRPVADFLPTISIKAKDLAAEMTSLNVQNKDLKGHNPIEKEHVDNSSAVRKMLLERGIQPENLAAAADIKKIQRKLESDEKNMLKEVKKQEEKEIMATLKPYIDYKPVDLNFTKQIPSNWVVKRGKYYFKEISERSKKGEEQLLSVSEHKGIVPRDSINVTMFQALSYEGYKLCNKGDIVINSLWAWHRGLGVSEHHGIVSTAYGVYRPLKPEQWNHRYLNYLLRDKTYVGECLIRSKGIWESRYQLTGSNFLDIPVLQPPLEVQNSIVAYLDKKNSEIDKFIRNKERLIELLEEQRKEIVFNLITSGINSNQSIIKVRDSWLGKMPLNWKIHKGRKLFKIYGGLAPTDVKIVNDINNSISPIDYYKVDDLNNTNGFMLNPSSWKVESRKLFVHSPKTVLLPKRGAAIMTNKVTITTAPSIFDSNVMGLKVNENFVLVDFICYWLKSRNLIELSDITTIPQLNNKHIYPLLIPLPDLEEQREIVFQIEDRTKKVDTAISKAQKEISSIKEYREALITDLVTGKRSVPLLQMN